MCISCPEPCVTKHNRGVTAVPGEQELFTLSENRSDKTVSVVGEGGCIQWLFCLWRREMRELVVFFFFLFAFFPLPSVFILGLEIHSGLLILCRLSI